MQEILRLSTHRKTELIDISLQVKQVVEKSDIECGMVNVYVQGATAAVMIQENWDYSVQEDMLSLLTKLIPEGVWRHDQQDQNGAAHLKSGLIGPSQTIPVIGGRLGLSTWQNIFLCEFDGPRELRTLVVTVIGA